MMDIEICVIAACATVVDKVEEIKVIASEAWARVEAPFKICRALDLVVYRSMIWYKYKMDGRGAVRIMG